jgi:hypothetical protein
LGFLVSDNNLTQLPLITGSLASGETHIFKKLGAVILCQDKNQTGQICKANAICHKIHETHDLLGTEVLRQFNTVVFNIIKDKYMELK